jgi:CBS domain-containing protein
MKTQAISAIMHQPAKTVALDDTVLAVETLLGKEGLSWAPVTSETGQVIGVISATDLLRFHGQERDPARTKAWQISTYRPLCVSPRETISEVARLMIDKQIHHVAVIENDRLCGVVSSLDFVKLML